MNTDIKTRTHTADSGGSFAKCVTALGEKGREVYGANFKIDPKDYETIFKLLVYMARDKENAAKLNINLNKGVLLSGGVGCGKTSLMSLLNYFIPEQQKYVVKTCRDISFEFIKNGYEVIHKYSNTTYWTASQNLPRAYCFDDLGAENNLKFFGNECNVMSEILLSRYELFVQKGMITHITTNLGASEIELLYGTRVRSRMREMFNLIGFGQETKDKRV